MRNRRLSIRIVTPAPPGSRKGNRVTALRWARALRGLGHRVALESEWRGESCDVLVALHARRSFAAIDAFRRAHPHAPLVLALTGTDLYGDSRSDPRAREALELASRLVILQPQGALELPEHVRAKARTIYQSATRPRSSVAQPPETFSVAVVGHLRSVKDPFRTAAAARLLPASSRVRVVHLGAAVEPAMDERARQEEAENPRYHWLGERSRAEALAILAGCRLLSLPSLLEGGANVVTEAIACGVPVVSSRIPGSIGILGETYPGYFPAGDTEALATLLARAERDPAFYGELHARIEQLLPLVDPARERESWRALLAELCPPIDAKARARRPSSAGRVR